MEYKLYNDGRFYNVRVDSHEQNPISEDKLNASERLLKEQFQAELNKAPAHYFKQPHEYKKQKQ